MFPSNEYIAGLFDGEGCLSFSTAKLVDGRVTYFVRARLSNNNRQVLELIQKRFGGYLHEYVPTYSRAQIHYILEIGSRQARGFLEAVIPHLVVKRNLAWIILCLFERAFRPQGKGHGWPKRLTSDDLELRSAVRDLVMKINSWKNLPTGSQSP